MVHIIAERATSQQVQEMLEALRTYIKVAVDVRRRVLAGGGEMHADCEAVLLQDDSVQDDIWGADWYPDSRAVRVQSLINIRPKRGNRSAEVTDPALKKAIEAIVKERLDV